MQPVVVMVAFLFFAECTLKLTTRYLFKSCRNDCIFYSISISIFLMADLFNMLVVTACIFQLLMLSGVWPWPNPERLEEDFPTTNLNISFLSQKVNLRTSWLFLSRKTEVISKSIHHVDIYNRVVLCLLQTSASNENSPRPLRVL